MRTVMTRVDLLEELRNAADDAENENYHNASALINDVYNVILNTSRDIPLTTETLEVIEAMLKWRN